jgi:serine/threonine-protein kinase
MHAMEAPPPELSERYRDRGLIALGGMGEVRRVYDEVLQRTVAMKCIRPELGDDAVYRERFREEARATARLEHPGIVPVYDHGELPDGTLFFTMREVRGETLAEAIEATHARQEGARDLAGLVDAFAQTCRAVAYAHHHGVLHRDLKPANIMLGPFGEVQVMDWGLVKLLPALPPSFDSDGTQLGEAVGTPAYMSPEQARGELESLSPASDVFALGAILYHLLAGRPPLQGTATQPTILRAYVGGSPPDLQEAAADAPWPLPPALATLCEAALRDDPAQRPESAQVLSMEVDRWLRGARRRAEAEAHVERAKGLLPRLRSCLEEADAAQDAASRTLALLPLGAPVQAKQEAWALEDSAARRADEADMLELQYVQALQDALSREPELREAHLLLADHYARCLTRADAARDRRAQQRCRALLARHDRGRHAALLDGRARVRFALDTPSEGRLYRFEEQGRRKVPRLVDTLGMVDDVDLTLAPGSYVLTLGDREPWSVALAVERGQAPLAPEGLVRVPQREPGMCWVPPGWFLCGGDPEAPDALPRERVWVDGFFLAELPVTRRDYLAFLEALIAEGRREEAERYAPRGSGGVQLVDEGPEGLSLRADDEAVGNHLDAPVVGVDQVGAEAYAAWLAERTGRPWRLPGSLEWEKAARGVDGRRWPWGDHHEPAWASCLARHGLPRLLPVGTVRDDVSVYGVRDLAGGVRDWTRSLFDDGDGSAHGDDPYLVVRGGAWSSVTPLCRPAGRFGNRAGDRFRSLGFRLAATTPASRRG